MTPQQAKIYALIRRSDVCPSYQEMADAIGVRSKSGVGRIVDEMVKAGLLRKRGGGSRNLEIVNRHKSPWLPISTAPRGMKTEILLCGAYPEVRGWSDVYHSWFISGEGWARWPHDFEPTHWMPLPDAPDAR